MKGGGAESTCPRGGARAAEWGYFPPQETLPTPSISSSHRYEVAFPDVRLGPKYEPTLLHGKIARLGL